MYSHITGGLLIFVNVSTCYDVDDMLHRYDFSLIYFISGVNFRYNKCLRILKCIHTCFKSQPIIHINLLVAYQYVCTFSFISTHRRIIKEKLFRVLFSLIRKGPFLSNKFRIWKKSLTTVISIAKQAAVSKAVLMKH